MKPPLSILQEARISLKAAQKACTGLEKKKAFKLSSRLKKLLAGLDREIKKNRANEKVLRAGIAKIDACLENIAQQIMDEMRSQLPSVK